MGGPGFASGTDTACSIAIFSLWRCLRGGVVIKILNNSGTHWQLAQACGCTGHSVH